MNKQEFLAELRGELRGIPREDIEERIQFYREMIDDRMEEGLTEEQAVAELGPMERLAAQILSEVPLTKLVRERMRPSRTLRIWEIVLLLLGSPVWLPLLAAMFAVILSIYLVVWSLIITLWAVEASFAGCSLGLVFAFLVLILQGKTVPAIALLGGGLVCAGLAIFGFFACRGISKGLLTASKKIWLWIKSRFVKKETAV